MLKGRFPSLKEFPAFENIGEAYRVIQALIVIHNLCIDWGDSPEAIPDYKAGDAEEMDHNDDDDVDDVDIINYGIVEPNNEGLPARERSARRMKQAGDAKRERILQQLFPL